MFKKKVSIIIRTKNSSTIIDQTLKSLYSQTFKDFNLIIVDSGSVDDTLKKVSKYSHTVINIHPKDYHPGRVINYVLNKGTEDIIVFLNSDCVMLQPNTLQLLLDSLEDNKTDAVYARQVCRPEAHTWVKRDYEASFPNEKQPSWMHFSLPLAAIRREVWLEIPFYTQSWASEDTKWAIDIKQKGYNIRYEKNALVMHSHNYNFQQLFNRKYVEGEADAYIFETKPNFSKGLKNYLGSIYHDFKYHIKSHDFSALLKIFLIRFVYHYSHYQGLKKGFKRKKSKDNNLTFGNYQ